MELSNLAKWVVSISPWKLFLAFILFPIIMVFVSVPLNTESFNFWRAIKITEVLCYVGYNYIIGNSLFQRLPINVSMNIRRFTSAIMIVIVSTICLFLFTGPDTFDWHNAVTYVIILASAAFTYGIFYVAFFIIRAITSIEIGREAKYKDYTDLIFFSMVLPFGVWVIQSRVKKIFLTNPD